MRLLFLLLLCLGQALGSIFGACATGKSLGGVNGTSGNVNTLNVNGSGLPANLLTIDEGDGSGGAAMVIVSDTGANTWAAVTFFNNGGAAQGLAGESYSYSKGAAALSLSATHSITMHGGNGSSFPSFRFCAWAGTVTYPINPFQSITGHCLGSNAGTVKPGSFTPSHTGDLAITTDGAYEDTTGDTVNSGFGTVTNLYFDGSTQYTSAYSSLVVPSTSPIDLTWTNSSSQLYCALVTVFSVQQAPSPQGFIF